MSQNKRGTNPNSIDALRKATASRKKNAKSVKMTLSPEAITSLDATAQALGMSRSELVERLAAVAHEQLVELIAGSSSEKLL
jgi:ribbon-helix-helix CopG family protein